MSSDFKQKIIIAIISGLFILIGAYISKSGRQATSMVSSPVVSGGSNVANANGGNATPVSNVSIVNQSVSSNNGRIAIGENSGNVSINQNSNSNSNVSVQINGQNYNP